jgi:putative ATP-dependent endonuclease of OLD family
LNAVEYFTAVSDRPLVDRFLSRDRVRRGGNYPETGGVVISTHSASFLDTEFFDCVGRVEKVQDDETPGRQHTQVRLVSKKALVEHCTKTGVPSPKTNVDNIGEFYKTTSNPMLNEAFFARFVILVEGDTEELALPVYLEKEGFDCDLLGISIISVRGKTQIPKYWRLFSAFQIPLLVMFDNDDDENGERRRSNTQVVNCFGLKMVDVLDVQVSRLLESVSEPRTSIVVLEKDFEHALRKDFDAWTHGEAAMLDQWEREARDLIKPFGNQNKGQIARFVARRLCRDKQEITPAFVGDIVEVLKRHGFRGSTASARIGDAPVVAGPYDSIDDPVEDDGDPF